MHDKSDAFVKRYVISPVISRKRFDNPLSDAGFIVLNVRHTYAIVIKNADVRSRMKAIYWSINAVRRRVLFFDENEKSNVFFIRRHLLLPSIYFGLTSALL